MAGILTRRDAWVRRAGTTFMAVVILAGGLCPALYAGMMPHAHLFVGGPPPPNWEHHDHENPLFVLFGAPPDATASPDQDGRFRDGVPATSAPSAPTLAEGRVVSLGAGAPILVLSIVDFAALHVLASDLGGVELASRLPSSTDRLPLQPDRRPQTPPPRSPRLRLLSISI